MPFPLKEEGRDHADAHHQSRCNASAAIEPHILNHGREPESRQLLAPTPQQDQRDLPKRPNETPSLPDERDKHTHARGLLAMAIDRISNQHSRHQLIADRRNRRANHRRDIPLVARLLDLHEEHDDAADGQQVPAVAQPEPELGIGRRARAARAPPHPLVRRDAAHLLADDGADDDGDVLQPHLLRVEAELLDEELRDLDCDHDAREEEDHGVGGGGHGHAGARDEAEGLDEVIGAERRRVDAAEGEIALVGGGGGGAGGRGLVAEVARFGAEEEVEEELDGVCLGDG